MKKILFGLLISLFMLSGCDLLKNLTLNDVLEYAENAQTPALTESDIISGLKEALKVGTQNAVSKLSKTDAFYKDPILKIPFPPEVEVVEEKLRTIGLDKPVDDFITQLNRGAEKAVIKASPIFIDAIAGMSISDAKNILHGADNAATTYFQKNTSAALQKAFKPEVQNTLNEINLTKYWSNLTTAYNAIPFTKKVETDLAQYVTDMAIKGLFMKIADEEKKIRQDPAARVTEILKKVFGSLNNN